MMKTKIYHVLALLSFTVIMMAALPASAQEGSPNNETPELSPIPDPVELKEEKPLLYEPEGKTTITTQRETTITTPAKPKSKSPDSKSPSKQEEDALSFNFLYYIIQKFKISDIVDQ